MKKKELKWMDLFAALAWLVSLAASIKRLAEKHRVPFEVFERLVSREGEARLDRLIRVLMDEYLTEKRLLNHHSFPIQGTMPVYQASLHEIGSLPWAVSKGRNPVWWSHSRQKMSEGGAQGGKPLYPYLRGRMEPAGGSALGTGTRVYARDLR